MNISKLCEFFTLFIGKGTPVLYAIWCATVEQYNVSLTCHILKLCFEHLTIAIRLPFNNSHYHGRFFIGHANKWLSISHGLPLIFV